MSFNSSSALDHVSKGKEFNYSCFSQEHLAGVKDNWPQYFNYSRRQGSVCGTVIGINPTFSKRSQGDEKWNRQAVFEKNHLALTMSTKKKLGCEHNENE